MAQVKLFEEPGIGVSVLLSGEKYLEIGKHGELAIPEEVKPKGFNLVVLIPEESRIVINQKNVGQTKGGYHRHALEQLGMEGGVRTLVMHDPISIERVGKNVWTSWHAAKSNRIDCWSLTNDGHVDCFQVGIITHDDGRTFLLLGEYRWRGMLFRDKSGIVGKPDYPLWGPFDIRCSILDDPEFKGCLESCSLPVWNGKPEELTVPMDSVPGNGHARVQWYVPFAGQTGQGIAILNDGSSAWMHGVDILIQPDSDGIKRLQRNDLVRYQEAIKWGTKPGAPPKLTKIERVS